MKPPRRIGATIARLDVVPSTMDLCIEAARAGAPHGHVIVARRQTAGRGRPGRTWHSGDDGGLYFSAVLRGFDDPVAAAGVTLAAGIGAYDAVANLGVSDLDLKWPNDLLLGGRKVAGVLAEWLESATPAPARGDRGGTTNGERRTRNKEQGTENAQPRAAPFIVLGIGLNVAQRSFPAEISETATSVALAAGRRASVDAALDAVLEALDAALESFRRDGLAWAVPEWSRRSRLWGLRARCAGVEGTLLRLDPDGSLVMRDDAGRELPVMAGLLEIAGRG